MEWITYYMAHFYDGVDLLIIWPIFMMEWITYYMAHLYDGVDYLLMAHHLLLLMGITYLILLLITIG
jgi:hypothetical protein